MKSFFIFLLLLATATCFAQQEMRLNPGNSCSFDGEHRTTTTYAWEASPQAWDMVRRICDAVPMEPKFTLKTGSVENAMATIQNNERVIFYSENFLQKLNKESSSYWAAMGVLAHEIGHHVNFDPLTEDESRPEIELKADQFAGTFLARLGATLEQAQAAVSNTSLNGSRTHPPRRARLEAVAIGWKKVRISNADTDGDGISDAQDACPTEFGSRKTQGCPDFDDDGIPNMNDDCPYEAGTIEYRGCPSPAPTDSDGDGVPDVSDKCKYTKGLTRFEGCPDSDGDNVPDHLDNCPNEKGLPSENGCPRCAYCPDMVFVQGGTFQMGSTDGDTDEEPVHTVRVDDFYIGKYEVTQAQWRAVMGDNPSYFSGCDNCPVENVSWNDVQTFIRKLNEKTGKRYRLPTEAEWEYAARGGNKSRGYKYAGSNDPNEVAWYSSNSGSKTHPVGRIKPNELGLYDMSGNVWEWCEDWYDADYYKNSPEDNPKGPSSGSFRVLRGGSWYSRPQSCRVADRFRVGPSYRLNGNGFRLAQD